MVVSPGPIRARLRPPVRKLFHPTTWFVLTALFIAYATTIPWDYTQPPSLDGVHWVPGWDSARNRIWSIPDMVQNVVLFGPFGLFAYLGLGFVRRRGPVFGALLAGLLGLLLSISVELLQTMSASRSPAATDLATNFTGALGGGIAAALWERTLAARFHQRLTALVRSRPGLLIFGLYLAAIVLGGLAPFIPTLDVGMLRHQVRLFLDNPWGNKPFGALLADALLFGALTFLAARELPGLLGRDNMGRAGRVIVAITFTTLLALGLEAAQLVIIGHSPGLQDTVVGIAAAFLAGVLALAVAKDQLHGAKALGELTRTRPALVFGFAILAPTLRALQPLQFRPLGEALDAIDGWQFVPFWALFRNINLSTFRNVFEAAAIYLPLGYALHALGKPARFGFLACLILAEVLEVLQIPVIDRVYDITEGLYAGLMGLFGAWALTRLEEEAQARPLDRASTRPPPPRAR